MRPRHVPRQKRCCYHLHAVPCQTVFLSLLCLLDMLKKRKEMPHLWHVSTSFRDGPSLEDVRLLNHALMSFQSWVSLE